MCKGVDDLVKTFRVVSAIFCVFGFFFALIGILSFVFPLIQNEHFKLILYSFQQPSTDALTNTLNMIVRFCLNSGYFLLFCGISLMVIGGLTGYIAYRKQLLANAAADADETAYTAAGKMTGKPKPAYYPGGMEPASSAADFEDISRFAVTTEEKTAPPPVPAPPSPGPIVGRIEPSFSSDESDAQRLMRFDQQIKEQSQAMPQYMPNDPEEETEAETYQSPEVLPPNVPLPADGEEFTDIPEPEPPKKPRIVSTMGKRKL